jgi:uncharacterized protein (TIGR03032 family)
VTGPDSQDETHAAPAPNPEPQQDGEARFHHSSAFPGVLEQAGCSLLVSTYQAGQLVSIGVADSRLHFSLRRFDRPMGVALADRQLAVGSKEQIWFLREHSEIAGRIGATETYDRCFLPHTSTVTGSMQCHEIAWGQDTKGDPELWMVNTLFSCLAVLSQEYSFIPRWRPPFVTALAPQDRCHLNGAAMRDGRPAFVTVMAPSDEPGGWRQLRNNSGMVLDVPSGEPVTTGLAMPHSPRWHKGILYVLNSGLGRLEVVDLQTGSREVVALLPGYARGLAFHGGFAFIGLSRIRETAIFGGAPIAAYHDDLKCGVGVIDLGSGDTVATLQFSSGIEEIFDVQVVPDTRCLALSGLEPPNGDIWLLPPSSVFSDSS